MWKFFRWLKWAVTFRVTPVTPNVTACHIPCNTSQVVESDTVIVYPCGRARLDVEKIARKQREKLESEIKPDSIGQAIIFALVDARKPLLIHDLFLAVSDKSPVKHIEFRRSLIALVRLNVVRWNDDQTFSICQR